MNLRKLNVLILVILASAGLAACGGGPAAQEADRSSTGEPAAPPAAQPAEGSGSVLFSDDFSDPASGWPVTDTSYFRGYVDGSYRIAIDQDEWSYVFPVAVSGGRYGDAVIEVDVVRVSGSESAGMYLICRYQDNDNYYYAELDGEGVLAVAAFFDDEQIVLIDDFATGVVPTRNRLRLDCIGSELIYYIDGERVLSAAPLQILEGDAGFGAGGSGRGFTEVLFDNFTVRAP